MINVPIFQGILFIFDSIRFFSSPLQQTNKKKKKKKFPFVQFKLISLSPMKSNLSFACNVTCCSVTLPYCYS